jgi:hypothetical protein
MISSASVVYLFVLTPLSPVEAIGYYIDSYSCIYSLILIKMATQSTINKAANKVLNNRYSRKIMRLPLPDLLQLRCYKAAG